MNIVLIGMPGAGKSTIGVLLAKALGYSFIDTDLIIQAKEGRKLSDIIATEGTAVFTKIENAALSCFDANRTVVATGGSAVLCADGMEKLKRNGKVVYLSLPLSELEKRLSNITTRGVVMREGETIADLMKERAPLYEKYADVTVRETGGIEDTVEKVIAALAANSNLQ